MIIVTGEFELEPGAIDAVRPAAIEMMRETAKEDGCRYYRFYADVEHPHLVRVYEEWDSRAALEAHMQTPHMKVWREALVGKIVSRAVKTIEGGTITPL